jgi:hypothetical protein
MKSKKFHKSKPEYQFCKINKCKGYCKYCSLAGMIIRNLKEKGWTVEPPEEKK